MTAAWRKNLAADTASPTARFDEFALLAVVACGTGLHDRHRYPLAERHSELRVAPYVAIELLGGVVQEGTRARAIEA